MRWVSHGRSWRRKRRSPYQRTPSRRPYSGINVLIFWGAVIEQGFGTEGLLAPSARPRPQAVRWKASLRLAQAGLSEYCRTF